MKTTDFTTTLLVDQSPKEAFNAINNVRGWWSEEIVGQTSKLNDIFDYHFEDIHRCRIKVIESIPDKKIVWHVLENYFKPGIFEVDSDSSGNNEKLHHEKTEWIDTTIRFEIFNDGSTTLIRFTHEGLVPEYECFDVCSNGWTHYIQQSLFGLITTGEGEPNSTGNAKTADEERFHSDSKVK
jgi:hypothetical protein